MHGCLRHLPLLALLLALALPGAASAATFTVNSTGDEPDQTTGDLLCKTAGGTCTLRAAITQANAIGDVDEIVLPAGTYAQASPLPDITRSVTITGAGARTTIIDGVAAIDAVLDLNGPDQAEVRGVTVTGGGYGVRVVAADALLEDVAIRENSFVLAGGASIGAGLRVEAGANVTVRRSSITGNSVTSTGGSLARGGGILTAAGSTLAVSATTIAGNVVESQTGSSLAQAYGGGISADGAVTLRHVTLSGNRATGAGGAAGGNLHVGGSGSATVADSIIAGGIGPFGPNCGGTAPTAQGRNIDSGSGCGFGAGHLSNTDPQLEPLGNAGGPTDSTTLKATSPARDAALACPDGGLDQRGSGLPAGPGCDIGAIELGADLTVSATASRADVAPGGDVTYLVKVTNNGGDAAPAASLDVAAAGSAGITVASASQGTCTTAARCELGTIAQGATVTATIVARAGATGPIAMSAAAASGLPDPAPANNGAALSTTVTGGGSPADTTAPTLGALKLTGKARTGKSAALRATLSEAATVTLKIERLTTGRRAGKRCLTKARTGKPCTLAKTLGTLRLKATAGTPTLKLPATLAKRKLTPGRHRITATATDTAGNRSKPRTLIITVVR
ncbi:MAG: CSLREA domain-containing protein [Solirubrobacteraceae bacterium]|nr:CSLREA domain-containing protein [Solirubrobacteraceae bacterium]